MSKATAKRGGQPAPYTKQRKREYEYHALYKRYPHLRHWKHNPIAQGYAAGAFAESEAPARGDVAAISAARSTIPRGDAS